MQFAGDLGSVVGLVIEKLDQKQWAGQIAGNAINPGEFAKPVLPVVIIGCDKCLDLCIKVTARLAQGFEIIGNRAMRIIHRGLTGFHDAQNADVDMDQVVQSCMN